MDVAVVRERARLLARVARVMGWPRFRSCIRSDSCREALQRLVMRGSGGELTIVEPGILRGMVHVTHFSSSDGSRMLIDVLVSARTIDVETRVCVRVCTDVVRLEGGGRWIDLVTDTRCCTVTSNGEVLF